MVNSSFLEGIDILRKYIPKEEMDGFDIAAEHDKLWFISAEWVTDKKDIKRLEELGWFIDEDSWACYT